MEFNFEERRFKGIRDKISEDVSSDCTKLIHKLLAYDPKVRPNASVISESSYF